MTPEESVLHAERLYDRALVVEGNCQLALERAQTLLSRAEMVVAEAEENLARAQQQVQVAGLRFEEARAIAADQPSFDLEEVRRDA